MSALLEKKGGSEARELVTWECADQVIRAMDRAGLEEVVWVDLGECALRVKSFGWVLLGQEGKRYLVGKLKPAEG